MTLLSTVNKAIPDYIAAANSIAKNLGIDDIDEVLEKINEYSNVEGVSSDIKTKVERALADIGVDKDELGRIQEAWHTLNTPIGNISSEKSWDIDWDTSKSFGDSNTITLDVGAKAQTLLKVIKQEQALNILAITLPDNLVLLNHDVSASYKIGADAKYQTTYLTASASATRKGAVEFDAYYQVPSNTALKHALWDYTNLNFSFWDLETVEEQLRSPEDNSPGLRMLTLHTNGQLGLTAGFQVGRAWALKGDGKVKDVSGQIDANIGFSKKTQYEGEIEIVVEKEAHPSNDSAPITIAINMAEKDAVEQAFNLNITAEIKGLDKIASGYIGQMFSKGDELIALLDKWSRPASKLIYEAEESFSEKWYDNLASLILGTSTADAAAKKLINDELSEILDKYIQAPNLQPEKLAGDAIEMLLATFDIDLTLPESQTLVSKAKAELKKKLTVWQKTIDDEIKSKIASVSTIAKRAFLAPLEKFGQDIDELVSATDTKVSHTIKGVLEDYQSLKQKFSEILEKSANIKASLAYEATESEENEASSFYKFRIEEPTDASVNQLYRGLILGRKEVFSRLLPVLMQKGKITVLDSQFERINKHRSKIGLSINIGESVFTKVRNFNSDLKLNIDSMGEITLSASVEGTALSSGFDEVRKASVKLVYGMAQQALDNSVAGNISIDYVNTDNRIHKVEEISGFLNSMSETATEALVGKVKNVPVLIETPLISQHVEWFRKRRAAGKFTGSSIQLTIPMTGSLYGKIRDIDDQRAFRVAAQYFFYAALDNSDRDDAECILAYVREIIGEEKQLADCLLHLKDDDEDELNYSDARRLLKKSASWKKDLDRGRILDNKAFLGKRVKALNKTFKAANAFRNIILSFNEIEAVVRYTKGLALTDEEKIDYLFDSLKSINEKVRDALQKWVDVNNFVYEFFSPTLNRRMMAFYLVLAKLTGNQTGFIRTLLTLSGDNGLKKIRVI